MEYITLPIIDLNSINKDLLCPVCGSTFVVKAIQIKTENRTVLIGIHEDCLLKFKLAQEIETDSVCGYNVPNWHKCGKPASKYYTKDYYEDRGIVPLCTDHAFSQAKCGLDIKEFKK